MESNTEQINAVYQEEIVSRVHSACALLQALANGCITDGQTYCGGFMADALSGVINVLLDVLED